MGPDLRRDGLISEMPDETGCLPSLALSLSLGRGPRKDLVLLLARKGLLIGDHVVEVMSGGDETFQRFGIQCAGVEFSTC